MSVSIQVAYPRGDGSRFDFDYYLTRHFEVVDAHFGPFLESALVTRGADDAPFHAIATLIFADAAARGSALAASGPVMADISNFTDSPPMVQLGDVVG